MLRSAAAFALFGMIAAVIVGVAWQMTREPIAVNRAQHNLLELSQVLPPDYYDNEPEHDVIWRDTGSGERLAIYRARQGGTPTAAVLNAVAPDGYAGPVRLLVAVDADGSVLGVRVIEHRETPGIGDAIELRRTDWLLGFVGQSVADPDHTHPDSDYAAADARWRLRQDGGEFDAITGATISSRAVVASIRRAVQYFAENRDAIFAAPAESPPEEQRNGHRD